MAELISRSAAAVAWLTAYQRFQVAAANFYDGMDGIPYDPDPAVMTVVSEALWKAVVQAMEGASPEAIREVAAMAPVDRLARAGELMRAAGLDRRERAAQRDNIATAEATIADLVRRLGPLPGTRSEPGAGATAPTAT